VTTSIPPLLRRFRATHVRLLVASATARHRSSREAEAAVEPGPLPASPDWLPSLPCAVGRSGGDDSGISIASAKLGEVRDLLGGALFLPLFEGLREEGPVFCLSAEPQDFDRDGGAPVPLAS
jgi:carotenoid epsilon hydroxylase